MDQRIILAAGHGGGDAGAVAQGTTEANETVQITNRTADYLRSWGVETVVVPHELGLVDSINWVNARYKSISNGLSIEIHKNSGGGTGVEVWAPSYADATSTNQAQHIVNKLSAVTGLKNRGVKYAQNNRFGKLGWTDDTNTYALLIEAGFIDVDAVDDAADDRFARGIAEGIMSLFGRAIPQPAPAAPAPAAPSTPPASTSKPVPDAVALPERIVYRVNKAPTKVWDLATNPNWQAVKEIAQGELFVAFAKISFNNSVYYITEYSYLNGKKNGVNQVDLDAVKQPEPAAEVPEVIQVPAEGDLPTPVVDVETPLETPDAPTSNDPDKEPDTKPAEPETPAETEPTVPETPTTPVPVPAAELPAPVIDQVTKDARIEAAKVIGRNGLLAAVSSLLAALGNWLLNTLAGVNLPAEIVVSIGGVFYAGLLFADKYLHAKAKVIETKINGLIGF